MQCKFVDSSNERCGSTIVFKDESHPAYGYCYGHALSKGLLSSGDIEARAKKISEEKTKANAIKARPKLEESVEKAKTLRKTREKYEEAKRLFDSIVGAEVFDLETMAECAKSADLEFKDETKNLLAMWWLADPLTRLPKTLLEVAKILDVNRYVVESWLSEDSFITKIKQHRLNLMELIAPQVDRTNMIQAIGGDRGSIDLLYKQIGYIQSGSEAADVFDDADDDMLDEAMSLSGMDQSKTKTIRTTQDEEAVIDTIAMHTSVDHRSKNAKRR